MVLASDVTPFKNELFCQYKKINWIVMQGQIMYLFIFLIYKILPFELCWTQFLKCINKEFMSILAEMRLYMNGY